MIRAVHYDPPILGLREAIPWDMKMVSKPSFPRSVGPQDTPKTMQLACASKEPVVMCSPWGSTKSPTFAPRGASLRDVFVKKPNMMKRLVKID